MLGFRWLFVGGCWSTPSFRGGKRRAAASGGKRQINGNQTIVKRKASKGHPIEKNEKKQGEGLFFRKKQGKSLFEKQEGEGLFWKNKLSES